MCGWRDKIIKTLKFINNCFYIIWQKNDDCTIIIDENSKRDRPSKSKDKREKSSWDDGDGRKEKRASRKRAP